MVLLCITHHTPVREEDAGSYWCSEGHRVHVVAIDSVQEILRHAA